MRRTAGGGARHAVAPFAAREACAQLRRCSGETRTLVDLDTTRGRRRRWCGGEVCGDRQRVARHRGRSTGPRG